MIIYMRHGKDARVEEHAHDEVLTTEGKSEIKEFTKKMVEENGLPDIIFVSPMMRTRQTLKYVLKFLKEEFNASVKIKVDRKLGRYFSEKEQSDPQLHLSTIRKDPFIEESKEEFKNRVMSFHEKLLRKYKHKGMNIWNITHSLVILRIIKHYQIDRPHYIQYLDVVIVPE